MFFNASCFSSNKVWVEKQWLSCHFGGNSLIKYHTDGDFLQTSVLTLSWVTWDTAVEKHIVCPLWKKTFPHLNRVKGKRCHTKTFMWRSWNSSFPALSTLFIYSCQIQSARHTCYLAWMMFHSSVPIASYHSVCCLHSQLLSKAAS